LKPISGKKLCRLSEKAGWSFQSIRGSHHIFSKSDERKIITMPVHGKKWLVPASPLASPGTLIWSGD
jgi:predicted RNA binding protein YcfA (HicA-like mRNA interferase family)